MSFRSGGGKARGADLPEPAGQGQDLDTAQYPKGGVCVCARARELCVHVTARIYTREFTTDCTNL